ncbi:MAG TPA: DUF937 domain-containing protein [Rhodothermales bacterium]|nr:DUF937 domain-containing protein [Rhodothermales bacterium]
MSGITDLVLQSLQGDTLQQLSRTVGADEGQTRQAAMAALPVILASLQRNAGTPQGAAALGSALERDHDGSLLDNLGPYLGGLGGLLGGAQAAAGGAAPGRAADGAGILGHIFGGRQEEVASTAGQAAGLDRGQMLRLLIALAPIVMAALARRQRQPDAPALPDLVGGAAQEARAQAPGGLMGALSGLLDSDNDGSIMDDLARRAGGSLLGGGR